MKNLCREAKKCRKEKEKCSLLFSQKIFSQTSFPQTYFPQKKFPKNGFPQINFPQKWICSKRNSPIIFFLKNLFAQISFSPKTCLPKSAFPQYLFPQKLKKVKHIALDSCSGTILLSVCMYFRKHAFSAKIKMDWP